MKRWRRGKLAWAQYRALGWSRRRALRMALRWAGKDDDPT